MATQDDDTLAGPVPPPDAEPTPAELAHARRFADVVDKSLLGRAPAAMSTDDRALLEVATVIRATHGALELSASRQRAIVEDALRIAIGAAPTPISAARRKRTWAPWAVAAATSAIAAAALVMLWLRPAPVTPVQARVPTEQLSRSADALVGPIARDHAGDAASRIDTIFADRLDGFRARRLGGKP